MGEEQKRMYTPRKAHQTFRCLSVFHEFFEKSVQEKESYPSELSWYGGNYFFGQGKDNIENIMTIFEALPSERRRGKDGGEGGGFRV